MKKKDLLELLKDVDDHAEIKLHVEGFGFPIDDVIVRGFGMNAVVILVGD